jgi:uncharacterized membrane protein
MNDTPSSGPSKIVHILNGIVYLIARHWLLLANAVLAGQTFLPTIAPVLMKTGHPSAARVLYTVFQPLCHQLPERSFFLFGPKLIYSLHELERLIGPEVPLRYIGSSALGYKIAVCQRDMATYAAFLLAGLAFALLRRRLKPLTLKAFVLCCAPMAIDGFGQLFAFWQSTWWSRVLTGSLFGIACVWLAYPYIEIGMNDVLRVLSTSPSQSQP